MRHTKQSTSMDLEEDYNDFLIRIRPFHYVHILDTNSNVVRVIAGPKKYTCLDHERVVKQSQKMVMIPPMHYVIIKNPVVCENGQVATDETGQYRLRHGDEEVRFHKEPFVLYPGESLSTNLSKLPIVPENKAIRLRAKRDFTDHQTQLTNDEGENISLVRCAGEEWLFKGPAVYRPQVQVEEVEYVVSQIISKDQALRVRARDDCTDYLGVERKAGEEWLVKYEGAYLPGVSEEVISLLNAIVLSDSKSIHVRALRTFTDPRDGVIHKAGSRWLLTRDDCDTYIPDVNVEVENSNVQLMVLTARQYCVIKDPIDEDTGKNALGTSKLVRGPVTFFCRPGEVMCGVNEVHILGSSEAYWVTATSPFTDDKGKRRRPGDTWIVYGPGEYWPPIEAKIDRSVNAVLNIGNFHVFRPEYYIIPFIIFVIAMFML